jgi:hypothetical protein
MGRHKPTYGDALFALLNRHDSSRDSMPLSSRERIELAKCKAAQWVCFWLQGQDLRGASLTERKNALASLLPRTSEGIVLNRQHECDGVVVYKHACVLGCEGIVSKRRCINLVFRCDCALGWRKLFSLFTRDVRHRQ